MKTSITLRTTDREQLIDITDQIRKVISEHGKGHELCTMYALGATAAIMIQENWDSNIQTDVISCLRNIVPKGKWLHDRIDGNGDSHIKAGIIGPSEIVPIEDGQLSLSTWQNIFFCEFDGPRERREVVVTLI